MQELAKKFGDAVRDRRLQLGVSQDALAYAAEIDRSYVGRIERGEVVSIHQDGVDGISSAGMG